MMIELFFAGALLTAPQQVPATTPAPVPNMASAAVQLAALIVSDRPHDRMTRQLAGCGPHPPPHRAQAHWDHNDLSRHDTVHRHSQQ